VKSYEEIRGAFYSKGGRRHRVRYQRRWTATVRHLNCVNGRCIPCM